MASRTVDLRLVGARAVALRRRLVAVLDVLSGAMGLWLGLQALRAFFPAATWNVRAVLTAEYIPLVVLGVCVLGGLGFLFARLPAQGRPHVWLGLLLGALFLANQALTGRAVEIVLTAASVVVWLWWVPLFLARLAQRGGLDRVVPGMLLGLALDVIVRWQMHGLDLPWLRGPASIAGACALALLFFATLWGAERAAEGVPEAVERPEGGRLCARGPLLLGPYLFLQLSLLTNLGRVQVLAGWDLEAAAVVTLASLLVAFLAVGRAPWFGAALGPISVGLLLAPVWLGAAQGWLIIPAQAGLAMGIAEAFRPTAVRSRTAYGGWVPGFLAIFALSFLYYATPNGSWRFVWLVAALGVAAPGFHRGAPYALPFTLRPAMFAVGLPALALTLAGIVREQPISAASGGTVAPHRLKVLTFNVHRGFDHRNERAAKRLADFIAARNPDLVALQEITRGDALDGGADLLAYLQWRLPQYHVIYGPTDDDLSGNAILTRFTPLRSGYHRFPVREDYARRGFAWVEIATEQGALSFVSTHLTVYSEREREAQVAEILQLWDIRPRAIIAGDLNARPEDQAMRRLRKHGFVNAATALGLDTPRTIPVPRPTAYADYVLTTGDLKPLKMRTPRVAISDHLPVEVELRLPVAPGPSTFVMLRP